LLIDDIGDGSGQQWLYIPQVNTTETITFIINLNCWDNDTLPIVVNNTYTLIYTVDPVGKRRSTRTHHTPLSFSEPKMMTVFV
jgi:hypothetical protein